jgi:hypothetical protein
MAPNLNRARPTPAARRPFRTLSALLSAAALAGAAIPSHSAHAGALREAQPWGLVYVCDRINNRIQVFRKDGTFVKEWFFEKNTLGNGAVWDIAIWPDPKQSWLLTADGENNEIRVLKRDDGTVVASFGRSRRNAGQFHRIHAMAIDAKGNVYTAEVDTGKAHPEIQAYLGRATIGALRYRHIPNRIAQWNRWRAPASSHNNHWRKT